VHTLVDLTMKANPYKCNQELEQEQGSHDFFSTKMSINIA
jgi:hypothetical protein